MSRHSCMTYRCSKCHITGVRLWRQYQTMLDNIELLCFPCGLKEEKLTTGNPDGTFGWLVPARPDAVPDDKWQLPDGASYWGHTSGPEESVWWWRRLPINVQPKEAPRRRAGEKPMVEAAADADLPAVVRDCIVQALTAGAETIDLERRSTRRRATRPTEPGRRARKGKSDDAGT